jgi:hypothetical protein
VSTASDISVCVLDKFARLCHTHISRVLCSTSDMFFSPHKLRGIFLINLHIFDRLFSSISLIRFRPLATPFIKRTLFDWIAKLILTSANFRSPRNGMAVCELFNFINWAYSFTMPECWNIYAICDLHCHFTGLNIKLCAPPAPAVEIFIITFHVRMRPAQPRK